jgi:hypothetical protein
MLWGSMALWRLAEGNGLRPCDVLSALERLNGLDHFAMAFVGALIHALPCLSPVLIQATEVIR